MLEVSYQGNGFEYTAIDTAIFVDIFMNIN